MRKKLLVLLLLIICSGLVYSASLTTRTVYGRTTISQDLRAVPTSLTDLTSTDTWIFQLSIANSTAGALTVTVQDQQGTPRCILCGTSIAANTTYVIVFPEGLKLDSGMTWTSSGSGLNASVVGWTD